MSSASSKYHQCSTSNMTSSIDCYICTSSQLSSTASQTRQSVFNRSCSCIYCCMFIYVYIFTLKHYDTLTLMETCVSLLQTSFILVFLQCDLSRIWIHLEKQYNQDLLHKTINEFCVVFATALQVYPTLFLVSVSTLSVITLLHLLLEICKYANLH